MASVLVVDSNLVYARRVSRVLQTHGKDIVVDVAHDIFILRDRLSKKRYDIVLADVLSLARPDELMVELEKLHDTLVIAWTASTNVNGLRDRLKVMSLQSKPMSTDEIRATVSGVFACVGSE
jgi:DNA-binding response OmpR family regulator